MSKLFNYTNTSSDDIRVSLGKSFAIIPAKSSVSLGAGIEVPDFVIATPQGEPLPVVETSKKGKTKKKEKAHKRF